MIQPPRLQVYSEKSQPATEKALSQREMRALMGACHGWCNKEIASEMDTSDSTVRNLLKVVYLKLRVDNRTAAVLEAIKRGWFSP